jgi:hypothetical protein
MTTHLIPRPGEKYEDARGNRYRVHAVVRAYDRKRDYVDIHLRKIAKPKAKPKR